MFKVLDLERSWGIDCSEGLTQANAARTTFVIVKLPMNEFNRFEDAIIHACVCWTFKRGLNVGHCHRETATTRRDIKRKARLILYGETATLLKVAMPVSKELSSPTFC
jgi:hypothetical protein